MNTEKPSCGELMNFLSCKLRCYTRIFSPEKRRINTREKIFFHLCLTSPISCWYVTRLLRHSVRLINERRNPSSISIQGRLSEFFRIMAAKTLEKSVSLTDSDVQTYLEGEENQNTERKNESYVFSGFGNGLSTTEIFATGRLILHCFVTSSFLRPSPFPMPLASW